MDVQCKSCGAEYSLDETLVSAAGTSVRCTKCDHIFRAYRTVESFDEVDVWTLRTTAGTTRNFERIGVLQQWIAEGKVSEDDEVSRNESDFKRLGEIAEMLPFFEAMRASTIPPAPLVNPVNSAKPDVPGSRMKTPQHLVSAMATPPRPETSGAPMARPVSSEESSSASILVPPREKMTTLQPPAMAAAAPRSLIAEGQAREGPSQKNSSAPPSASVPNDQGAVFEQREPSFTGIATGQPDEHWDQGAPISMEEDPAWIGHKVDAPRQSTEVNAFPLAKRRWKRWLAGAVILTLLGGSLYVFVFERSAATSFVERAFDSADSERFQKFYDRGRESFLLDSEQYYRRADREFQKVLALHEGHAPTLAALSEMYSVWAQYLKDAAIDAQSDAEMASKAEAKAAAKEIERLVSEYNEKVDEAAQWADDALKADESLVDVNRAVADVRRLQGDFAAARDYLKKARTKSSDPATEYIAALLDIDEGKSSEKVAMRLEILLEKTQMLSAMYRRARVLASMGQGELAQEVLDKLFELNSDHVAARELRARLESKKPVVLVLNNVAETMAGLSGDTAGLEGDTSVPEPKKEQKKPAQAATSRGTGGPGNINSSGSTAPAGGGARAGASVDELLKQASRNQQKGRTSAAIKLFEAVLEKSPSNMDALSGLGFCYLGQGSHGQAIASFRRALSSNARFGPSLIGIADAYKAQGQKDQALRFYKKYLSNYPSGRDAGKAKRNVESIESESAKLPPVSPSPEIKEKPASPAGTPGEPSGDKKAAPELPDVPSEGSSSQPEKNQSPVQEEPPTADSKPVPPQQDGSSPSVQAQE